MAWCPQIFVVLSTFDASVALQLPLFTSVLTSWLTGAFDFYFFLKNKTFLLNFSVACSTPDSSVIELKHLIKIKIKINSRSSRTQGDYFELQCPQFN